MTAATTATRPLARRPSPLTPRGTVWTALRLHGAALWIWVALVTVTAAGLLWAYGPGADAARKEPYLLAPSCGTDTLCGDTTGHATLFYEAVVQLAAYSIAYLPYLVAAWAGATLVARELESGTAALAWTQSVTPARWLTAQLAVPAALITAGTTVLVLLHRLMWTDGRDIHYQDWYETDAYRSNGTVAVAAALCALAVGALAGMLIRRTLPALGLAVLVTVAVQTLGDFHREKLWPAVTVTGAAASNLPNSAQQLERGVVLTSGERIGNNVACAEYPMGADLKKCMSEHGISDIWATYHPASHFWPLQLTETALLLTLTALAVLLSFRVLKRRTA
ncbi:hypothetical protein ACFWP7_13795 [Streptomyces sp. NPDC058470]|uniref:hypothetical protein n=1 Tax=Streptomyces sp. NPDC058470 TaxID=3346515 RepID=UPI0036591D07